MSNEKSNTKLDLTIKIDQEIWADFNELVEDVNKECTCPDIHSMDEVIQQLIVESIQKYKIAKILLKYKR